MQTRWRQRYLSHHLKWVLTVKGAQTQWTDTENNADSGAFGVRVRGWGKVSVKLDTVHNQQDATVEEAVTGSKPSCQSRFDRAVSQALFPLMEASGTP